MNRLVDFSCGEYSLLLHALRDAAYRFQVVGEMRESTDAQTVYLRHDIDFMPAQCTWAAEIEAEAGVRATYYVALTQPYNPSGEVHHRAIRYLVELGHEIGLHYDLLTYPSETRARMRRLAAEARYLESLAGAPVTTISMHNPSIMGDDPFRELDEYVHPHDPRHQEGLLYVSDSCRGWRDENLLRCFAADPPKRLLLLTHPELWLDGSVADRQDYIHGILIPESTGEWIEYLSGKVADVWRKHPGAIAHDQRESARPSGKEQDQNSGGT